MTPDLQDEDVEGSSSSDGECDDDDYMDDGTEHEEDYNLDAYHY
jgi:hypothetical protein